MMNLDKHKFLKFGITEEQIDNYDVILLPENYFTTNDQNELYDATESILLAKLLKNANINVANSFDLGLDIQTYERRSNERWFGLVYLRNNLMMPVVASVIATMIASAVTADSTKEKVHIEIKTETTTGLSTIKYEGDSETLIKMLNAINESANPDNKKENES